MATAPDHTITGATLGSRSDRQDPKMKKLVVTGGLGHIGSRVLRSKVIEGFQEIIVIDDLRTQRYCSLFGLYQDNRMKFVFRDLSDVNLDELIDTGTMVLHLAAITDAAGSFENADIVEKNNFQSLKKVADTCLNKNANLIHLSSTSVYGSQVDRITDENSDNFLSPQSPYAETKIKEERYLQGLANLNYLTLRFGTIVGPSAGMRFHTAVNKFVFQALNGLPITVWETALHQVRPYLSLTEACELLNFVIANRIFNRRRLNIVSDNLSVNDILEVIKLHVPAITIEFVNSKIMNQLSYEVLGTEIARLGFSNRTAVKHEIASSIKFLREFRFQTRS